MARPRVVVNRRGFGVVMASAALELQLRPYADRVASQIPGARITAVRTGLGSVSSRVRLRVEGEWHQRQRLVAAIRSVLNNAKPR